MLKRTLLFQSDGCLSMNLKQLCFTPRSGEKRTVPVEDIGIVLIDSVCMTVTVPLLNELTQNNICVILCNSKHLPASILLPMSGNALSQKVIAAQIEASEALKDRLWKQTVRAKIRNQAQCLQIGSKDGAKLLQNLAEKVQNGDPENIEGTAARAYFKNHFPDRRFLRDPDGDMPNPALNYGYAVLRAAVARALVSSGLLTIIGIHHHNQYNEFCLADDIMEPYRPFVDDLVMNPPDAADFMSEEITSGMKQKLLSLLAADVRIDGTKRPLMSALSQTSASLARCFLKEEKEISFPVFC